MSLRKTIFFILLISIFFHLIKMQIIISDCNQLLNISNNLAGNYILAKNINCSFVNFVPIGNLTTPFQGSIDGQGYYISDIIINSSYNYTGVFGKTINAIITNIILMDFNILSNTGTNYFSSLVGELQTSTLNNIQIKSSNPNKMNLIQSNFNQTYCGGVVGYSYNSTINNVTIQNTFLNVSFCLRVGGIVGVTELGVISNCHNIGFPSSPNTDIISGFSLIGGVIGYNLASYVSQCGTVQGTISGSQTIGSVIGIFVDNGPLNFTLTELYSKSNVKVVCSVNLCGGLIGRILFSNDSSLQISNSYTTSNVTGNISSGFLGYISVSNIVIYPRLFISNCYSSNFLSGTNVGSSIAYISNQNENFTSTNFYFNNETNPNYPAISSVNTIYLNLVFGLNCNDLLSKIQTFNQSVWGGDSLRSEYGFTPTPSLCSYMTTPPTNFPSTMLPSTIIISTTNFPSFCVYQVANCSNCDQTITKIDSIGINVTCIYDETRNKWMWAFKNSSSSDFLINSNLTLNTQIFFDSNLVVQSNTTILVDLSNSNSSIVVNGCVDIQGNLNVLVNFHLDQQQTFSLVNYNCSQVATLSNNQISVIYDKKQNQCLKSNPTVTINTISTTINVCGNKNYSLVIALSVSLPLFVILFVFFLFLFLRWKMKKDMQDFQNENKKNEMEDLKKQWKENDSHKDDTNWKEFNN